MSHLTMEQLLELREPGLEPGIAAAREHLTQCAACQAEADRLAQRVARLRALPIPRPSRDGFLELRARLARARRRRRLLAGGAGALALAASVALAVVLRNPAPDRTLPVQLGGADPALVTGQDELAQVMARSRELEEALQVYDPDSRSMDGRTAAITGRLEDQLTTVDRQLQLLGVAELRVGPSGRVEQLRLWRERVGLLDALMDVHLTRATYAGL